MAFGIDDAIAEGLKVINKWIPDPAAKAQAEKELRDSLIGWDQGQQKINEAEAGSDSLFVAGWRPAIGWSCAAAVLYSYLLVPLAMYVGFLVGKPLPKPPTLDEHLWELLFILLGVGGLRTFEKIRGVAR
jgi:hypothetical protein